MVSCSALPDVLLECSLRLVSQGTTIARATMAVASDLGIVSRQEEIGA